jgi:PAS domain S-box-containing protein
MRDLAEGPGDLDSRLEVSGGDEMAELARQFNALMDRLQASFGGVARNMRRVLDMVGRTDDPGNTHEKRAQTLSEATAITEEIVDRVTATIEAWKQAERSRALLASIVESSDDAIYGTDLDGKVLSWNRGAERAYGWNAAEMVGRDVGILAPQAADAPSTETLDAIRRGEAQHYCETKRVRVNGEVFPVSVTFSPLHDEQGRLVGAAVIERDITQRREAEEAAARQHQQLVQADKLASLGTLVAGVAHEISNPNSFIMLNAPVIRDIWMDLLPHLDFYRAEHGDFNVGAMPFQACRDWVPTLLTDIENGADRIKGIVASLKDYARQDPPTMRDLVDVNQVVRSAVTLTRSRLDKATHRLEVSITDDLPAVRGSFQRIEQVVVNLILNACDALPSPGRAIRIGTRGGRNDGVELFVEDEGTGMDARTLSRIRDPFFTTKRNSGGTGLGVSISDGIVHEHGGTLDFQSEEGRGTLVTVELPSASSHRDDPEAAS